MRAAKEPRDDMPSYIVSTPELESEAECPSGYGSIAIWYRLKTIVEAPTRRAAKALAIRDSEFYEYVCERRDAGLSPFTGMKVEPAICSHGVLQENPYETDCVECKAEQSKPVKLF